MSIFEIIHLFKKRKVKLVKYNSSLDKEVQNEVCYDAFMQISEDETNLIITNKKPVKMEYILASTAIKYTEETEQNQDNTFDSKMDFNHDDDGLENEEILMAVS